MILYEKLQDKSIEKYDITNRNIVRKNSQHHLGALFSWSIFMLFKSCTISILSYLFMKKLPRAQKGLQMSLLIFSTMLQITINNLMLFKHQNGLLSILKKKRFEHHPHCYSALLSEKLTILFVRSCLIIEQIMSFSWDTMCLRIRDILHSI